MLPVTASWSVKDDDPEVDVVPVLGAAWAMFVAVTVNV